jgi:hypothetical protein
MARSRVKSPEKSHDKLEKWPKATTPCTPLEQGNTLVAYELVVHERKNAKEKQINDIKIKVTNEKRYSKNNKWKTK